MKQYLLVLLSLAMFSWPVDSLAISFNAQEISAVVKITSYLSEDSVNYQVRSLKDFFSSTDEVADYRRQLADQQNFGSGFFITYSGCALTNKHVVYDEAAGSLHQKIQLWSTNDINQESQNLGEAQVIYYRTLDDLAIVCLADAQGKFFNRAFVKTPDYKDLKINLGENLYTLGYPSSGGDYLTLSSGIVSGRFNDKTLKTTMPITAGASGSPVFNEQKQIVGLAQANTGPFDQLGLFLAPDLVLNWHRDYEEVYRSVKPEDQACENSDQRGIYKKNNLEYYDLSCTVPRNLGLELKLAAEHQNYCPAALSADDAVAAANYIASGKSSLSYWTGYLELNCLKLEPEALFRVK